VAAAPRVSVERLASVGRQGWAVDSPDEPAGWAVDSPDEPAGWRVDSAASNRGK
jgi:hypothetical protein